MTQWQPRWPERSGRSSSMTCGIMGNAVDRRALVAPSASHPRTPDSTDGDWPRVSEKSAIVSPMEQGLPLPRR